METGWKSRQTRYGLNTALYIIAALAIVVVINLIANRAPTRLGKFSTNWQWDLTASKRFSLSQESDQILSKLDMDVQILYFDRRNSFDNMRDLLDQFQNKSRRISITYVDPDREPNKATQYNIKEYGKIVVVANGKNEQTKGTKEEDIINSIIRLEKGGPKTIYFLQGHGEHELESTERLGYSDAKKALEESNYQVKTLSLLEKEPKVPDDAVILVIAGAEKDFLDPEINAIKDYLMVRAGRIFVMVNPHTPPKLQKVLADLGADVSNNLVVDESGLGRLFGTDELMPLVLQYDQHPITKDMANTATIFPLANAVQASASPTPGAEFTLIAKTTANSWATKDVKSKEVSFHKGTDIEGPLALMGAGTFRQVGAPEAFQARYVVAGSADFISNAVLGFNGNRDLFLNSMAWLASDEDLISIRPKDPEDRRLDLSPGQLTFVKYFSLGFMPLVVVLSGLGVWWKRRN